MPRSETEIMDDLVDAYMALSPEEVDCDGEISAKESKRRRRQAEQRVKDLCAELGREVEEDEVFIWATRRSLGNPSIEQTKRYLEGR